MNTPAQAELGRGTPKTYKMVRLGQPPHTSICSPQTKKVTIVTINAINAVVR